MQLQTRARIVTEHHVRRPRVHRAPWDRLVGGALHGPDRDQHVVGLLTPRETRIHPRVHHTQCMIVEIEHDRRVFQIGPVLRAQLVGRQLVGRAERSRITVFPCEQPSLVIASHPKRTASSRERDDLARLRPSRHQIARQHEAIRGAELRGVDQRDELVETSVHVAHEQRSRHQRPSTSSNCIRFGITTMPLSVTE